MSDQNKAALLEFLDFVSSKGLMKQPTAQSLKSACSTVFSILDDDEEDILAVDLDDVFQRFENIKGLGFNPGTLRAYRQRVKQAVSDFQRYKSDPSHWKPLGGQRSTGGAKRTSKRDANSQRVLDTKVHSDTLAEQPVAVDNITHQFPLRRDTIARISGIPFDVTKSEMGRLNAFLSNLVVVPDDAEPTQLMLRSPNAETE